MCDHPGRRAPFGQGSKCLDAAGYQTLTSDVMERLRDCLAKEQR